MSTFNNVIKVSGIVSMLTLLIVLVTIFFVGKGNIDSSDSSTLSNIVRFFLNHPVSLLIMSVLTIWAMILFGKTK